MDPVALETIVGLGGGAGESSTVSIGALSTEADGNFFLGDKQI